MVFADFFNQHRIVLKTVNGVIVAAEMVKYNVLVALGCFTDRKDVGVLYRCGRVILGSAAKLPPPF